MGVRRSLAAIVVGLVCLSGCTRNIAVESEFPMPVMERLPVRMAAYYSEQFSTYEMQRSDVRTGDWSFDIGRANVELFERLFVGMFDGLSRISDLQSLDVDLSGIDCIIEPTVEQLEFRIPEQSEDKFYDVTVQYRLRLYRPDRSMIDSWVVLGEGRSLVRLFEVEEPLEQATRLAMRDAAADFAIGFSERSRIQAWLAEERGIDLARAN